LKTKSDVRNRGFVLYDIIGRHETRRHYSLFTMTKVTLVACLSQVLLWSDNFGYAWLAVASCLQSDHSVEAFCQNLLGLKVLHRWHLALRRLDTGTGVLLVDYITEISAAPQHFAANRRSPFCFLVLIWIGTTWSFVAQTTISTYPCVKSRETRTGYSKHCIYWQSKVSTGANATSRTS